MTSKEDDTLPLPGLSLEFSVDAMADEDFIPTSQPQGNGCSKVAKTSETSSSKSTEEPKMSDAPPYCTIDDTLPREAVTDHTTFDKDKSSDFIPDTETKKIKITYAKDEPSCKKKLQVISNYNICQAQSNPSWETQMPQIPESPAFDTQHFSVLNGSQAEVLCSHQGTPSKNDKSIAEIIVNDSAETVDLEGSPMRVMKSQNEGKTAKKLSILCSINSDAGRCEETQIFDNSIVLLEHPGPLIAAHSEKSLKETKLSQKLYPVKTVDNNESDLQEQENLLDCECSPPAVPETTGAFLVKEEFVNIAQCKENTIPKEEPALATVKEQTPVTTRKIDFKLTVTCFVTFNTKTNKVLRKFISKVNETSKTQTKFSPFEHSSDNASDKSKRHSTSSSGSVYSDKHGLPFALSKRVSTVSDQTDSSEEDFSVRMREKRKAFGRTPWSNEYLLPLKLDELMQVSIESQQIFERSSTVSSLREPKTRCSMGVSHLKETVKSSSSETKSVRDVPNEKSQSIGVRSSAENVTETPEDGESVPPEVDKAKEDLDPTENDSDSKKEVPRCYDKREKSTAGSIAETVQSARPELQESAPSREAKPVEEQILDEERSSVVLGEGVPVLARWTDKRYYSGVLCGSPKNERWDVKFDDGTLKTVREDLIMPVEWLKVGALVFALVDDKYVSGQIIDIERGKEVTYAVELDVKKKKVSTKASDLCLTDVMASIVREKYKPLGGTPRRKADIDFDNVLSGKRLREQRTPSRLITAVQLASSEAKRKSSSKKKEDECALEAIEETPGAYDAGKRAAGLKSEGGHLVEDKVASADSPSGNETGGTPLRRSCKETRERAKPRTLSYGAEESRSGRGKSKSWLTEDGTPIPGPSGVKFKRKKPRPKEDDFDEPPRKKVDQDRSVSRSTRSAKKSPASSTASEPAEKGKNKRRLDGCVEENVQKKSFKRGDVRMKTKSRKG